MTIRLAEHSGFCFGVLRAIETAYEAGRNSENVCTLGELIHNPGIVSRLANAGIKVCNEAGDISGATVVIRSHGVPPAVEAALAANANTVIDATCPYVKRIQELVADMTDDGYTVLILGDSEHPEVIGIKSYARDRAIVVDSETCLDLQDATKLCLVSQTTGNMDAMQTMAARLVPLCKELRVYNTICHATTQRQKAAEQLAKDSDMMIVIGGYNSSNTAQLTRLCARYCTSIQIESAMELAAPILLGKERIGITAGASTPAEAILEVYNRIKEIIGDPDRATCIGEIPLFKEESC